MQIKIGMFTTGMHSYWTQMPGLKGELESYAAKVARKLSAFGRVINKGFIGDVTNAREAGDAFIREDVDFIVIHAGTYGLSRDIIPCLRSREIPILSLHLQPVSSFDDKSDINYTMGKNPYAISGEIGSVLRKKGLVFDVIAGRLDDDAPWNRIKQWSHALSVRRELRSKNIGILGSPYTGMTDLYADYLGLMVLTGINIDFVEPSLLRERVEKISKEEIEDWIKKTEESFELEEGISSEKLNWPSQVAAGMDRLRKDLELNAMTFHFGGFPESPEDRIGYSMTLGGSLLYAAGCPCPVEGDAALSLALIILEGLGSHATQGELNIIDYENEVNYINHSGPGNIAASEGRPLLKWLDFFHGRRGSGVSTQFRVKHGPLTILSILHSGSDGFEMLVAEGESVDGVFLPSGNMNTRVRFPGKTPDKLIEEWVRHGPSHHLAICPGHLGGVLEKLSKCLGIKYIKI